MIPKSKRTATTVAPKKPASATQANSASKDISQPKPARSMKAFSDATTSLHLSFTAEQLSKNPVPTKQKSITDALHIVYAQLNYHHTKAQFITLSPFHLETYTNIFRWFLKRANSINDLSADLLLLITNIIAYINATPVSKASEIAHIQSSTKQEPLTKQKTEYQAQDLAQYYIFQQILMAQRIPIDTTICTPAIAFFEPFFKILLTNYSTTHTGSSTRNQYFNSLLTIMHQIIQFCVYFRNELTPISQRCNLMNDTIVLTAYSVLVHFFNHFLPQGNWATASKLDLECIATIITISSTIIMYDTPSQSDEDQEEEEEQEETANQNAFLKASTDTAVIRLNSSPDTINSVCTIIFSTLASFITFNLQNQIHPFISLFSTSSTNSDVTSTSAQLISTLNPTKLNYNVFNAMISQIYAQAHFLTVCSTHYLHAHSQSMSSPQEQAQIFQQSPYTTFINADLIKLFILYFQYLDEKKLLSIENHQQTSIRNIILVLFGSGNRFHISMLLQADYFEFLLSLVWESGPAKPINSNLPTNSIQFGQDTIISPFSITHGKPRDSAIVVNPTTLAPKTQDQKRTIEQTSHKQQQIEFNRLAFFTSQLDSLSLFANTGYASRMLLLKQYNIIEVLYNVIIHKVFHMDQILRKQGPVVEKIALFIKNFISSIDVYNEFDYSMFIQLANVNGTLSSIEGYDADENTFSSLKQRTIDWMTKENNGKAFEQDIIDQRLADDVYSLYISFLFSRCHFASIFSIFIPTLCLYYNFPTITDPTKQLEHSNSNDAENTAAVSQDPNMEKEMDSIFQHAMVSGGKQIVDNNHTIIADLINFSHFSTSFHLFSYISTHFTSTPVERAPKSIMNFSPLQRVFFASIIAADSSFTADDVVSLMMNTGNINSLCQALFTQITKTLTKSILLGLHIENSSSDNPRITMKDSFKVKTTKAGSIPELDSTNVVAKIDVLVSHVVVFTLSMLNNKKYAPGDDNQIAEVNGFTNLHSVEDFIAETFPNITF